MSARFTREERDAITTQLKKTGRSLFAVYGLRKTSLDQLVEPVRIAKSTFYVFFDSKEALYLELMMEGAEEVRRRTIDEGLDRGKDTRESLRLFLRATVDVLAADPLYRRLTAHPEEIVRLNARLDSAQVAAADNGTPALLEFVADRQNAGELPGMTPAVVVGVLRAVLLLPLHSTEFGDDYPQVLDGVIDAVTAGLTASEAHS